MDENKSNSEERRERLAPLANGEVRKSLLGYYAMIDIKTYRELEGLADFLRSSREEIAALRPEEIPLHHIPTANDELGAVVKATEAATGTILDAVEKMEALASQLTPEQSATIQEAITMIYEACNFQDITGQRVTKVFQTLTQIETRVDGVLEALGQEVAEDRMGKIKERLAQAQQTTGDAGLMNGPQLPANAQSQADIDALFASFG
jgi:chemotaxis protein CheZ